MAKEFAPISKPNNAIKYCFIISVNSFNSFKVQLRYLPILLPVVLVQFILISLFLNKGRILQVYFRYKALHNCRFASRYRLPHSEHGLHRFHAILTFRIDLASCKKMPFAHKFCRKFFLEEFYKPFLLGEAVDSHMILAHLHLIFRLQQCSFLLSSQPPQNVG